MSLPKIRTIDQDIQAWQCEVIEAFGLDPQKVLRFKLEISYETGPVVTVDLLPDNWPKVESVTKRFELREFPIGHGR